MAKNKATPAETPDVQEASDLPAVITSKTPAVNIGGFNYKMKRRVVLPLLKHGAGQTVYIQFLTRVYIGKEIKSKVPTAAPIQPAKLANVVDLTTGEEMVYIVSAVLESTLMEEYPEYSYVDKAFAVYKVQPDTAKGKRYATFSVAEIEQVD